MAKKVTRAVPGRGLKTETPPGKPGVAAGRWVIAITALAALGAGGAFFWHRHQQDLRAAAALPATPELAGKPAELGPLLRAAQARAGASQSRLEGMAELGRLYHASGFNQEAEACWKILRAEQPQEARWSYYLADLHRRAADEEGLKALLEQTVQLAPAYAPAWLELAELEFKAGRLDAAEAAYRRRLGLVHGDPYASFGLARLELQRGHHDEGKRLIEEIVRTTPDFPSSHNMYAELLAQEGDAGGAFNQRWLGTVAGRFRAAEDPWKEELRAWCYDPDQLIVWGVIDLQTKHGDRGKSLFERAIHLAPEDPRGYENLGLFYLDSGDTARAREVLEQGSKLPGASEPLYLSLCNACRALHQPAEALRVTRRCLEYMPESAGLSNALGLALDDAGHPEEALEAFRAALVRAPSAPDPMVNIGVTLLRLGRKDEASASFKQALALQPMYARALALLARLEMEAGHLEAAAQYIRPYYEQFPGSNTARDLMAKWHLLTALTLVRAGDPAAAERACRAGLAVNPEAAELFAFLGVLYTQQHRQPEALEALETSRRLQPADPRVTRSLAELYIQLGRTEDARRLLAEGEQRARQGGDPATAAQLGEMLRKLPQ